MLQTKRFSKWNDLACYDANTAKPGTIPLFKVHLFTILT